MKNDGLVTKKISPKGRLFRNELVITKAGINLAYILDSCIKNEAGTRDKRIWIRKLFLALASNDPMPTQIDQ